MAFGHDTASPRARDRERLTLFEQQGLGIMESSHRRVVVVANRTAATPDRSTP
jgi:hypothetical protein